MKVLVTGARGFVGKNLCTELRRCPDVELFPIDIENSDDELQEALSQGFVRAHVRGYAAAPVQSKWPCATDPVGHAPPLHLHAAIALSS